MREKTVETKIKYYLAVNNIYHFKVHGSSFMEPGIPDIIACYNGLFIGIEVKRPGAKNTQTEVQKVHERNIKKSGGLYFLVDGLEDFVEVFNEHFSSR